MPIPRTDKYANFSDLCRHEAEGRDFRIHLRWGRSGIAVVAPHGGRIERGTMAIAEAIAGSEHTYYCFEGVKPELRQNRSLHITSDHFDEPRALKAVQEARRVVTIHGAAGAEPAVFAGGLDLTLRRAVLSAIAARGICAADDPSPTRQGRGATNICNRGWSRMGLQLEFTFGLRRCMFGPINAFGWRPLNSIGHGVVAGVREALARFSAD